MGVYPCYATEAVMQMARDALGSYCLTAEQREDAVFPDFSREPLHYAG